MRAFLGYAVALWLALGVGPDTGNLANPTVDSRRNDAPALRVGTPEPPATEVAPGEPAPDFSFQGTDGRWRHLHDLSRLKSLNHLSPRFRIAIARASGPGLRVCH